MTILNQHKPFLTVDDRIKYSQSLINSNVFGVAEFSPSDISGLKLWLDSDDPSTITKDVNDFVSQQDDKSGEGNHVVQATGSNQPKLIADGKNSRDILRYDGVNDRMKVSTFTGGSEAQINTVLCVAPINPFNGHYIYDSATADRAGLNSGDGGSGAQFFIWAGSALFLGSHVTTIELYTVEFNGASSILRKGKVEVGTGNAGTGATNGMVIGNFQGELDGNTMSGDFCELLFYNKQLSTAERDDAETFLADRWAV